MLFPPWVCPGLVYYTLMKGWANGGVFLSFFFFNEVLFCIDKYYDCDVGTKKADHYAKSTGRGEIMKPVLLQACCLSVGTRRCLIVWASAWANWMEAVLSSSSLDCWAGKTGSTPLHFLLEIQNSGNWKWRWNEGGFPAVAPT